VRTVLVVMLHIDPQHTRKLPGADDQELVQALLADGPDPPFGDGVGVRRLNRCADDLGTGRAPHVIERPGELGVPVADQELARAGLLVEDGDQVASLLGNPPSRRVSGDAGKVHPSVAEFDDNSTYMRWKKTVSTVKKSQARIPAACWRRNDRQLVAVRRGAGSRPWARSTRLIELADTRTPRRNSLRLEIDVPTRIDGFLGFLAQIAKASVLAGESSVVADRANRCVRLDTQPLGLFDFKADHDTLVRVSRRAYLTTLLFFGKHDP
jgi:hypothetical protein